MAQAQPQNERRNWSPVRQQAADSYLILMIATFAITVIVVRMFLQLTGYPQVGSSTFHIAHLLWGGLALFIAVVLILTYANHWVMWVASFLGGLGVGLFIDEVGKFITQSNDYFFPLAFPIIYAFLLVCIWLYLRVRRSRARDTRTLLYHALEDLKQVIDNDLDPFEHTELVNELTQVAADAKDTNEQKLAQALLEYVQGRDLRLARQPNTIERMWGWTKFVAARWPSRRVFKALLIVGFGLAGLGALLEVGVLAVLTTGLLGGVRLPPFVIVSGNAKYETTNATLLLVHAVAIIVTGVMSGIAAILLALGKERAGLRLGTLSLILSLTVVNLLTFYFSQLYAVGNALAELILLAGAIIYRWRFYLNK